MCSYVPDWKILTCLCEIEIKKKIKWLGLTRDVNMKILLLKRYFTFRSAFVSYNYQKEPEQNQKGHRSTSIHRRESEDGFGGEEILRYRNHE